MHTATTTAAVQRLHRTRQESIRQDYETLAGIDRGRRLIWSGRAGVWYHARIIDLGRRPDVSRTPRPADTAAPTHTADDVAAAIRRWYYKRGNAPASIQDVADALGLIYSVAYAYLRRADLFDRVRKGGGNSQSLYIARSADLPARSAVQLQLDTLTPGGRRMLAALQAHPGPMRSDALAAAANVSMPIVRRYTNECAHVFLGEKRREIINKRPYDVLWISLQPAVREILATP